MAPLKRGIPRYQSGTADVLDEGLQRPVRPVPPTTLPVPAATYVPVPVPPRTVLEGPRPEIPTTGFGQLMAGDFAAARDNPASSPVTHELGKFLQNYSTGARAGSLGPIASPMERLINMFAGDKAVTTPAIREQDAISKVLNNPLVQEHVRRDPNALAAAEKDPGYFAKLVQLPEYVDHMKRMQGFHVEAAKDPRIHPDDVPKTAKLAADANATPGQINALLKPELYSKEEFHKAIHGMPAQAVQMLFGAQLAHVVTPQEALARQYFGTVQKNYKTAAEKVAEMEGQNAEAIKAGKNPPHSAGSWFGDSPLDIARKNMKMWETKLMEDMAAAIGVTGKPYPTPLKLKD
jgi:hypothetical protein